MPPPELLLGPLALTVGLAWAVRELWLEHKRADQRDRDIGDRALKLAEDIVPTVKELAAAQAAANKDAAERRRLGDGA